MSRHQIDMDGVTTKSYVCNSKNGSDYNATIHNLSGQSLTVTATNDDIQSANPTFDTPAQGALVIADGAIGALTEPYDGLLMTLAGAGTGNIVITEAG